MNDFSKDTLRILVTGFGPFRGYEDTNPSWLAVKQLNNTVLRLETSLPSNCHAKKARQAHITSLFIPVTYSAVLSRVPGFYALPPILPDYESLKDVAPPPKNGYDLILHVGVGGAGCLKVEQLGHKTGYNSPDADGKYAPIVLQDNHEALRIQTTDGGQSRGFGKGYENFANELHTDINIEALVHHLHEIGYVNVATSFDAGSYLCDFIYYCSLAERSRATQASMGNGKTPKTLFVHCPPTDQPLGTRDVVEGLKRIIHGIAQDL